MRPGLIDHIGVEEVNDCKLVAAVPVPVPVPDGVGVLQ